MELLNQVEGVVFHTSDELVLDIKLIDGAGKKYIIDDIRIEPTSVDSVSDGPQVNAGSGPSFENWLENLQLGDGFVLNADYSLRNAQLGSVNNPIPIFGKTYNNEDFHFFINQAASATSLVGTIRVFGRIL